jgi:hypothetical protein
MSGQQYVCERCRNAYDDPSSSAEVYVYINNPSFSVSGSGAEYTGTASRRMWLCWDCFQRMEGFLCGTANIT